MTKLSKNLDQKQKIKSELDRRQKKSSAITDGHLVTGMEKIRTQGKGDKNRIEGWYSEETTIRIKEIFGKKEKKSKTESS